MLVDLGRNDLGRNGEYGSVNVRRLMAVERYSHVMLSSARWKGNRAGTDAFDRCGPRSRPALSAARPRCGHGIIEELEGERRGLYAGAIGYITYDGSMDTCIAIRTMVMQDDDLYSPARASSPTATRAASTRNV